MTQGYCVRCKAKNDILEGEMKKTKNGRDMLQGKCSSCGTKVSVFMKGDPSKKPPKKALAKPVAPVKGGRSKAKATKTSKKVKKVKKVKKGKKGGDESDDNSDKGVDSDYLSTAEMSEGSDRGSESEEET